jgi:prepilin-type N-terminal cleavage/methylation domain-containing protein
MRRRQRRRAFTLVELLVAMALIVFIMSILSAAFTAATKSFRDLKAAGDMADRLRSVGAQLRRELAADHFEGKKRLSQTTFWQNGPPEQGFFRVWQGSAPAANNPLYQLEGVDQDGIESYRAVDHMLHFTVKLRGNNPSDLFSASGLPAGFPLAVFPTSSEQDALYTQPNPAGGTYNYSWAEVAYFLRPSFYIDPNTGQQVPDNANGTPLYSLYRRQRLLVPDNSRVQPPQAVPAAGAANPFLELSCAPDPANPNNLYFNSPYDITVPARRFGMAANGAPDPTYAYSDLITGTPVPSYRPLAQEPGVPQGLLAADLVLTDVVSFEVRLLFGPTVDPDSGGLIDLPVDPANPFVHLYNPVLAQFDYNGGTSPVFQANGPRVFDTWSSRYSAGGVPDYSAWNVQASPNGTSIPMYSAAGGGGPTIRAIQITVRVWDQKTSLTRQMTIVQAL